MCVLGVRDVLSLFAACRPLVVLGFSRAQASTARIMVCVCVCVRGGRGGSFILLPVWLSKVSSQRFLFQDPHASISDLVSFMEIPFPQASFIQLNGGYLAATWSNRLKAESNFALI
jgi:hypothetical protein